MLFHGYETQATRVGDLLIAAPIAHQTHQMLFSLREPRQMRQRSRGRARTVWAPAQAFEFNEKMRPRYCGRTDLFQTDSGAKISPRWMPNCLVAEISRRKPARPVRVRANAADAALFGIAHGDGEST